MNFTHRDKVENIENIINELIDSTEIYLNYLHIQKKHQDVKYHRTLNLAIKEADDLNEALGSIIMDRLVRIKDRQIILDKMNE
ncbi:MAG: hypothetical protein P8J51_05715 [Dehalococcoidia bacterium]|nr:hypothetical protein [Dehalococcoidia bacterium]